MSRRALLIRVLIFGPLLAYFGYGAIQKYRAERASDQAEADAQAARQAEIDSATKTVKLQDGRSIDIVELTPEQAERLHGIKMKDEAEAKSATPAVPAAPGAATPDAKSGAGAPAGVAPGAAPAGAAAPDAKAGAAAPDARAGAPAAPN